MKTKIEVDGKILNGTISTARSRCGKENCACKSRKPKLHGTYYRWTGIIEGKRTTKTITLEIANECRKRIQNYKKFKRQLDVALRQALKEAPWTADPKK
jgi:predicted GNAT superfamily acetyltransferase